MNSKSDKMIDTNIKDVFISQVQYKSCGMTVVSCKNNFDFYISKRGKNIYGLGTDVVYGHGYTACHSICLVGGSMLGLEGICGINQMLVDAIGTLATNSGGAIGACCYTWNIFNNDYTHPDVKLGKFAFNNQKKQLLIGNVGAGVNTRVGKLYADWKEQAQVGGQGCAYFEKDKMKCFCIVVLNSLGVVHENGKLLHDFKIKNKVITNIKDMPVTSLMKTGTNCPKNTTLVIFLTNVKYSEKKMKSFAESLNDVVESMIYPYGTYYDGDTFFFASSNEIKANKNYLVDYKNVVRDAIKSPFG